MGISLKANSIRLLSVWSQVEQPKALTGTLCPRLEQERSTEPSSSSRLTLEVLERSLAQGDIATSLTCKAKQTQQYFFSHFCRFQDSLHNTLQHSVGSGEWHGRRHNTSRCEHRDSWGSLLMGFVTGNAKNSYWPHRGWYLSWKIWGDLQDLFKISVSVPWMTTGGKKLKAVQSREGFLCLCLILSTEVAALIQIKQNDQLCKEQGFI